MYLCLIHWTVENGFKDKGMDNFSDEVCLLTHRRVCDLIFLRWNPISTNQQCKVKIKSVYRREKKTIKMSHFNDLFKYAILGSISTLIEIIFILIASWEKLLRSFRLISKACPRKVLVRQCWIGNGSVKKKK